MVHVWGCRTPRQKVGKGQCRHLPQRFGNEEKMQIKQRETQITVLNISETYPKNLGRK